MTQTEPAAVQSGRVAFTGNTFVMLAIGVAALALGVIFHSQLGMPLWAVAGGVVLAVAGMAVGHISVVRGHRIAALEQEIKQLRTAVEKSTGTGSPSAPPSAGGRKEMTRARTEQARTAPIATAGPAASASRPPSPQPQRSDRPGATPFQPTTAAPAYTLAEETALAQAMAETDSDGTRAAQAAASVPPVVAAMPQRQVDATAIHDFVKKLAAETTPAPRPAYPDLAEHVPRAQAEPPAAMRPSADQAAQSVSHIQTTPAELDPISESVRALRATADAMRPDMPHASEPPALAAPSHLEPPPHAAEPARQLGEEPLPVEPPPQSLDAGTTDELPQESFEPAQPAPDVELRLNILAEALAGDRIDVMLEPILGLKDQAARHYEVSIRLRTESGEPMDPSDDRHTMAGTGILPLIDIAKLPRIAHVARLLAERGKNGSVFAALAGESLGDDDFLTRFAEIHRERAAITEQLVIALAQNEARVFTAAHLAILKEFGSMGFRFALEHVTDLDMDFDALRAAGIQFVKVDAEVFLEGLPAADGTYIPASDVFRFLVDKGLSLIVGEIGTEAQLMRIVENGVLFGQGRLFGGARPVKANMLAASRPAA